VSKAVTTYNDARIDRPAAITVDRVSKVYRVPSVLPWKQSKLTEALHEVSFTCPEGKISCLLGPNGAGKTTIIKILACLVLPDDGDAVINGVSISGSSRGSGIKIGLATPNERSFYWRLTGRQNLEFYASLYGLNGNERQHRVSEVLAEVGLDGEESKPFRLYSAGMKQKLLLGRAVLCRPGILLLDEPTTHLDPLMRGTIHRLVESFVEKWRTTVLLCTHDLTEAQELADHLIFLNDGRVQAEGTLASLRAKIQPHVRLILDFAKLPRAGWESGLPLLLFETEGNRIELEIEEKEVIPEIVDAAVGAGGRLEGCRHHEESLSGIFARLSGGPQ